MLSYFPREAFVGNRRLARIWIALCVSVFAHLAVLILFSQSGVGIVQGDRGGLQIYLPAATIQGARTENGRSEVPAELGIEPSPTPLSKAVPSVANEPKPRRRTESPPAVRKNEIPQVDASVTAATVAQQNVSNVPQMRVESGGGAVNGGQLKRVSIDFDVLSGTDKRVLSRGRHVYVAEREYFGISVSDVPLAGQADKDSWRIEISGRVNVQGLSPILYETRGALPQELMALKNGGTNRHAANQALQRKWQMPDGVLDRQSLLYHFMFKPPELTGGNVWLSDGSSHALYAYRMAGTESLPIAGMGNVSTLKLLFTTSASQERIELWLLPDRHYLPLKARYVDGLGAVTEQTATSIDFE
jgi:hypothetical protein